MVKLREIDPVPHRWDPGYASVSPASPLRRQGATDLPSYERQGAVDLPPMYTRQGAADLRCQFQGFQGIPGIPGMGRMGNSMEFL